MAFVTFFLNPAARLRHFEGYCFASRLARLDLVHLSAPCWLKKAMAGSTAVPPRMSEDRTAGANRYFNLGRPDLKLAKTVRKNIWTQTCGTWKQTDTCNSLSVFLRKYSWRCSKHLLIRNVFSSCKFNAHPVSWAPGCGVCRKIVQNACTSKWNIFCWPCNGPPKKRSVSSVHVVAVVGVQERFGGDEEQKVRIQNVFWRP